MNRRASSSPTAPRPYAFVRRTLVRFEYHGLGRPDKGLEKRFIEKVTGFARAQVTRLA